MSLTDPPEDLRTRANLSPPLALRVAIIGSVVLGLFAIVFFRLWFLQVLTGTHYVEAAAHNTTRSVALAPPRGEILARSGVPLVTSTTELALEIVPDELPVKVNQSNILSSFPADDAVYDRLAHLLHWKTRRRPCIVATPPPSCNVAGGHCPHSTTRDLSPIACKVAQEIALSLYANVTVTAPVRRNLLYYIDERANEFQGVEVTQTSVPGYPYGELAAQTLGTVGRLTTAQQAEKEYRHVNASAVVGQTGLEASYDQFLRGTFGHQKVRVDANGVATGEGRTQQPIAGDNLKTSLDLKLQQTGDIALQHAIDANNGFGGAFVAINPQNGSIYAMGSLPSFNPSLFTRPVIPTKAYDRLNSASADFPLINRAIQSVGPDGSTFKVITATAALQSGAWTASEPFDDTGAFCPDGSGGQCFHNSGGAAYGDVNLEDAIKVSDDVYFYHLGDILNVDRPQGGPLQRWSKLFGVGQNPHIDLPYAADGSLPTPASFDHLAVLEKECETATGPFRYTNGHGNLSATPKRGYHRSPEHLPTPGNLSPCGLGFDGSVWTVGQNILTAVGQGNDQLSPLQLALVYSAIENGGTIVRPHLGEEIESPNGTPLQKLNFPAQRHLHISPANLAAIQTGLHEAAQGGGDGSLYGTSEDVMGNFGEPVYGKTGTAQYIPTTGPTAGQETDYAWYSCYVPASATHKPIEIVVWNEGGGFGDIGSAPVARQLLSQWFYGKPGPWIEGKSQDQ